MSKKKIYACDFEATTDPEDCRVWAYGFMNIYDLDEYKIGNNLKDFMLWLLTTPKDCYFHNLRYDGSFILGWLMKNGYKLDRNIKPKVSTFNTTISENGQWYKIDITLGYSSKGKGKQVRHFTTLFCSLKKLPFSIKRIAQAFNLPVLKGDIDYHADRPIRHIITPEEYKYIKNDIEILARALHIQLEQGLKNITIGTDAMSDFKARFGRKEFNECFPVLDESVDDFLRKSYKGGFTWCNPLFQNVDISGGIVYDVNSLYPFVMRERLLPYGIPTYFKGKYEYDKDQPLYIIRFEAEFQLKEGYIPTIQIKGGRFTDNEYLVNSDGEQQMLTLTSVDLDLMYEHYDVFNVIWHEGYKFAGYRGFFDDYIDYWGQIKKDNKGAIRELAKLMLNNLYGKFGKNPDVTPKLPYLKADGSLGLKIPRNILGEEEREYDDGVYIPLGSFITAYARQKTISTAQMCCDRILYCDTDSIHLKGKDIPESIKDEIDDKELGFWAHECTFDKAKFIRQKTYVEMYSVVLYSEKKKFKIKRMKTDIKCAGMPDRIKKTLSYDEFKIGLHKSKGKLIPIQVNNGCVMVDRPFTLK